MAIKDLLVEFEKEETLPVDLSKLCRWIRDKGIQDEVEFIGVELDIGVIRGFLHRFRYQKAMYGDPVSAAHIYYGLNQEPEWINMVCAKEMLHLCDNSAPTRRKEDFDNLIKRLALPLELKVILEDPEHVLADRVGDGYAAALLLPLAARHALLEPYRGNKINVQDIAKLALMPVRYAQMVMSDMWEPVYERMKNR